MSEFKEIEIISAKATKESGQSDSIVVSFGSEWRKPLLERKFKAVIRKRVPRTLKPRWLYFHINAPVSALCARAEILAIRDMTLKQTTAHAADLALSPAEIETYFSGDPTIGYYELGKVSFPKKEVGIKELNRHMKYFSPQSFFNLSIRAKEIVDALLKFENAPSKQTRTNEADL